ncbi:MAG: conserved phage C-terminal domain-containing protein [Thermodesulfobacteriota bacterium]|nr:conserved phage C-terminal domain-containing protein [Thermodesulfobacteriota bacterium]
MSELKKALEFCRDIASEEYPHQQHNPGAEITLRNIIKRCDTVLANLPLKRKLIPPPQTQEILDYLNEKKGSNYRDGTNITARLREGRTVEECKRVIDNKFQDPDFLKNPGWLCPDTLFRKGKFDKNLNWTPPLKARLGGRISENTAQTVANLQEIRERKNEKQR